MSNQEPNHPPKLQLDSIKRIVIKIGTRVIDKKETLFNKPVIRSIVQEIAHLRKAGIDVVLVSSGAVGAGIRALGVKGRPASIHLRQAYAAIGQGRLMNVYTQLFEEHDIMTAQILLTRSDLDRRTSYLNVSETIEHLLTIGVVPIINENDTVAIEELKFTDNDILAALVAGKIDAGLLLLLTTVDGLYKNFQPGKISGELIEVLEQPFEQVFSYIQDKTDRFSIGGMRSKLEAAKVASKKGVPVVIANGLKKGIITNLLSGQANATWIMPAKKRLAAWKYYLAFAKQPGSGRITVDDGAAEALRKGGKSLLASGVKETRGKFVAKDLVTIFDSQGHAFAKGLTRITSKELRKIQGRSSQEIKAILNSPKAAVVIHRNNLVLID